MKPDKIKTNTYAHSSISDETFYENIKSFKDFDGSSNEINYFDVPSDWIIIMTDIKNSTEAILKGQYKDVNIIGAACIAAVENSIKDRLIPSSFGGDGASFIIPPTKLEQVKIALGKVQNSSHQKFKLELRISIIPVKNIIQQGYSIKVAKFELAPNKFIAKFSGGGLSYAEKLMKKDSQYQIITQNEELCSFDNLSCRWKPIKNKNGTILTLIAVANQFEVYEKIIQKFNDILGKDASKINPIKNNQLEYKNIKQMLNEEYRFEQKTFSLKMLLRTLEIVFCYLVFNIGRNYLPKKLKDYKNSMMSHSDFRKFEDGIKMVVDCSIEEKEKILEELELLSQKNEIKYGVHESENALMTCFVTKISDGGHIHFIDGDNGGYALAAKQMKKKFV